MTPERPAPCPLSGGPLFSDGPQLCGRQSVSPGAPEGFPTGAPTCPQPQVGRCSRRVRLLSEVTAGGRRAPARKFWVGILPWPPRDHPGKGHRSGAQGVRAGVHTCWRGRTGNRQQPRCSRGASPGRSWASGRRRVPGARPRMCPGPGLLVARRPGPEEGRRGSLLTGPFPRR